MNTTYGNYWFNHGIVFLTRLTRINSVCSLHYILVTWWALLQLVWQENVSILSLVCYDLIKKNCFLTHLKRMAGFGIACKYLQYFVYKRIMTSKGPILSFLIFKKHTRSFGEEPLLVLIYRMVILTKRLPLMKMEVVERCDSLLVQTPFKSNLSWEITI